MPSKSQSLAKALIAGGPPEYDLVGPTVEDDIRRAINRYGAKAVKDAAKQLTKSKRGRPNLPDYPKLRDVFEADARDWLDGRDPMAERSNYSIAKSFAETNPGQSPISTYQRIERKLAKKPFDRTWIMLVTAEKISRTSYSWEQHLRVLQELSETDTFSVWTKLFDRAKLDVADYERKNGEPPPTILTMNEVENGARHAVAALALPKGWTTLGMLPGKCPTR